MFSGTYFVSCKLSLSLVLSHTPLLHIYIANATISIIKLFVLENKNINLKTVSKNMPV